MINHKSCCTPIQKAEAALFTVSQGELKQWLKMHSTSANILRVYLFPFIGESTFGYCMDLMGVYKSGSVKRIAKNAFEESYYAIQEVGEGSYGQTFANENKLGYTLHPVWLK